MKSHNEIKELLIPFVLGQLSEKEASEITRHLVECEQCSGEVKRLGKILECARQTQDLSADERLSKSAKDAILAAAQDLEKTSPRPTINIQNVWRTIIKSRITRFAAAAVIIITIINFWPSSSGNGKWWLGPPAAWGQEILKTLAAIKGVSCREQTILIAPDGSRHTSSTWDMLYVSQDSYRRDIYDGNFSREIQWYVPDANGTLHQSIRFDLESYFMSSGEGSFGNCDPVERMRFYVGLLNKADTLLGEQVIEGRNCVGFEIRASKYGNNPEEWVDRIWFDVETKLPVCIEKHGRPVTDHPEMTFTTIQDQFDYDPQLPADTFTPWVPEGFVYGHPDDIRAAREQKQNE